MPNWEIIEQHIQNMEEALTELGKYRNITFEEFQRDLSLRWVAYIREYQKSSLKK